MPDSAPLQPLLHDATIALAAPAQAWSRPTGQMTPGSIDGFFVGDRRILSELRVEVVGSAVETIGTATPTASTAGFTGLLRGLDDASADPKLRLVRRREVHPDGMSEVYALQSALPTEVDVTLVVHLASDLAAMPAVKAGLAEKTPPELSVVGSGLTWGDDTVHVALGAEEAAVRTVARGSATVSWTVHLPARGVVERRLDVAVTTRDAVVLAPPSPSPWTPRIQAQDVRLTRWVERAVDDLGALRMSTRTRPDAVFLAAGAPWFFTLFGRDSIWAARLLLPLGTDLARDTLRVLADLQGTTSDPDTAEQPGKIMHELRAEPLGIPAEGVVLPPLYYGTIDATALWVNLLADAWRWGMSDVDVEALLPHLEAALIWLREYGDSDGDGFLEYVDESGRGLANQGWKDSGDSIQWNDGRLATGPIALCEVQGYAYEAATRGAELLEHFGRPGAAEARSWAARLKARFREQFWVEDERGRYPAIALDAEKRPVDSLTSNIGHLLGTGILDGEEAAAVAARLVGPELDSGYGLRTMATTAAGYWPLSYHGGSVWAHDTAIVIAGLAREGFAEEAGRLSEGLLAAAEGFDYRMPELHSGDPSSATPVPVPYPAACRPQAWSAAAAVAVLAAALGLEPDPEARTLRATPVASPLAAGLTVEGLAFGGRAFLVTVGAPGAAAVTAMH